MELVNLKFFRQINSMQYSISHNSISQIDVEMS